ncbi:hypothetical protein ABC255_09725 [Neobacillus sp. 3P2-tot-E-2]|uniref:hypothetical protein n=1 Tax=Neobacillus sp. 3P2-tot-E-2 TaxID=3132212 RepID=UPI0039A2F122
MGFFKEFFSKENMLRTRINVEIIAGHPTNARYCNIASGNKPGEVFLELSAKHKTVYRPIGIEWEESSTRSAGSAAMGALAGKMVGGTVGGIAGAAVGGRKRDNSKAYVYLEDLETGEEVTLHIRCDEATYRQIDTLFRK